MRGSGIDLGQLLQSDLQKVAACARIGRDY